ncbi:MAG: CotH kinase family protein [Bacteroidaceae bacterium]|nr:CotH kinase family protein [Bacteroidaceae bacterium]
MKTRFSLFYIIFLGCFCCIFADAPIEDGVYSISCTMRDGYLGLGAYHNVEPYIYYVTNEEEKTDDAYWVITHTASGYTFRNEATNEILVYTTDRDDSYYKYMTLAEESLGDQSEFWNIIQGSDGAYSIQSVVATGYYWNLRKGTNMLGTFKGSGGDSDNERFVFNKRETGPGPDSDPDPQIPTDAYTPLVFPNALHVFLTDGRVEAYPLKYVTNYTETAGKLVIETNIGRSFTYDLSEVASVSEEAPADFPTFESYKFNNKFNDQLFTDATGEMVEDTVFVTIAAIGKRLTPSFKVSEEDVEVYAGGVLQESKETRMRFDKDVYYVVTRTGCSMLLPEPDTEGGYAMQPYGRVVRVHLDWLTDRAEVPTIYINTSDGQAITSKEYFKDAEITIDGHGIFPSMETTAVQIKGRGNSSWGWPKKPYRLKFANKEKPLGMTKGKSWVLLSNYQTGSLMSNAIGMKAANLMGAAAANHIVPVDLYLNGEYRGNYNFTEKVGLSNNSVDLTDDGAAALLELDSYYDEATGQKFRSQYYNLPINVKEPDFSEGTSRITLQTVETDFNQFMATLYNGGDLSQHVDVEQLVRFLMVNELICNYELYHPKSTFCYRESFESDTSKYVFGPVWDLDWAFGYEGHGRYYQDNATSDYWSDMPFNEVRGFMQDIRYKYRPVGILYQELWEKFMNEDLTELMEFCQDYYDFAHTSFERNRTVWSDGTNYGQQVAVAANWLETRTNQIWENIVENNMERVNVTYDYVFEDQVIYSETVQVVQGRSLPDSPQAGGFLSLEPIGELPATVNSDCRVTYRVTWNGPFQFTHSMTDAHWYNLTIRSKYHVGMSDTEPYHPQTVEEETLMQPEYQWAFGGDPLHIKVYNRATGLSQVLTLDGQASSNQVNAVMRSGDYSWQVRPNSDGFVLSPPDYPNVCINQFGGSSGGLQTWNDKGSPKDDGSTFRIVQEIMLGDVNGDGVVDLSDAIMVTYYSLHEIPSNFNVALADMNGDGEIDLSDAIIIIYKSLGVK